MAGLFGDLGLQDSDRLFAATTGQMLVYEESQRLLDQWNADVAASMAVFVDESTWMHKERYKLPGGGRLQRRSRNATPAAQKAYGQWDVAYPLEDFGAQLIQDDISMAYMTLAEYRRHFQSILIAGQNTVRFELLKRLFNNTASTFVDEIWGSLTVQPLANGDGTLYPPVVGSETEADETCYYGTNYVSSSISDSNDPTVAIINKLESHYGTPTGGSEIVIFCNQAETPYLRALKAFTPIPYLHTEQRFVSLTVSVPGLPDEIQPGRGTWRVLGTVGTNSGAVLVEWRYIPAGYMIGVHLEAPRPIKMRFDPPDTGLGQGLQLVTQEFDAPFRSAFYRHRFGFGCANRLNGVCAQLVASTSYTIPTVFA